MSASVCAGQSQPPQVPVPDDDASNPGAAVSGQCAAETSPSAGVQLAEQIGSERHRQAGAPPHMLYQNTFQLDYSF